LSTSALLRSRVALTSNGSVRKWCASAMMLPLCFAVFAVEGSPEDDVAVLVFLRGGAVKPRLSCPMERACFEQALIWLRRRVAAAPTTSEQFLQTTSPLWTCPGHKVHETRPTLRPSSNPWWTMVQAVGWCQLRTDNSMRAAHYAAYS
jgi:hypothetical protein